ncbi:MAG: flavin reductase family protein [Armatimonadota bacterium]
MGRLFYSIEELLGRPTFPGIEDPTLVYYHFRPARPANLLVTRDPDTGDLNLASGTYGPLTDRPYTLCLHLHSSPHSTHNLSSIGAECVVALPGRDLVRETWIPALPLPRGISELEVAELTPLPSQVVGVPGIAECPVNLECRVEFLRQLYGRTFAVFLRVIAASIDEEMLARDRLDVIEHYPTYEVDDATNVWGGSIERLGLNGELFEAPGFPACAKRGFSTDMAEWLTDLRAAGHLSDVELARLDSWISELTSASAEELPALRAQVTHALRLAAWEEWDHLHAHLGGGKGGQA